MTSTLDCLSNHALLTSVGAQTLTAINLAVWSHHATKVLDVLVINILDAFTGSRGRFGRGRWESLESAHIWCSVLVVVARDGDLRDQGSERRICIAERSLGLPAAPVDRPGGVIGVGF